MSQVLHNSRREPLTLAPRPTLSLPHPHPSCASLSSRQAAPAARLNLLHALTQLVAESRMVHTSLVEEEESARQKRREIQGMRVEIRTWHAEAALRSAGGAAAQEGVSAR